MCVRTPVSLFVSALLTASYKYPPPCHRPSTSKVVQSILPWQQIFTAKRRTSIGSYSNNCAAAPPPAFAVHAHHEHDATCWGYLDSPNSLINQAYLIPRAIKCFEQRLDYPHRTCVTHMARLSKRYIMHHSGVTSISQPHEHSIDDFINRTASRFTPTH